MPGSLLGRLFLAAYLLAIPALLVWEPARQAFWTCGIAALPLVWVGLGFHAWRRACPLAWFARLGAHLGRDGRGRAPARLQRVAPLVQLGLMLLALTLRHLAINGDRALLAGFLVLLALAAALTGLAWSGRAWCNVLCPVGLVERVHTEPAAPAAPAAESSRCTPCNACVRHCPDLDLARAHRTTLEHAPRRWAALAWPGVVLGFYLVWRLESGGWEAYLSGGWAHEEAPLARWAAPGLVALPWVPRWVAIPLVLGACGAVSALALASAERLARALGASARAARQAVLAGAGGLGLGLFYLFAGQPTLRLLPLEARVVAGVVCAAAVLRTLGRGWAATAQETARSASPTSPIDTGSDVARRRLPVVA